MAMVHKEVHQDQAGLANHRGADVEISPAPCASAQTAASRARPAIPFVTLSSMAVGALLLGLVVLSVLVAQTSFRLTDLQSAVAREEARYRHLRFQVATAESPEMVAKAAGGIGMVPPQTQEYIVGPPIDAARPGREGPDAGAAELKALLAGGGRQGQVVRDSRGDRAGTAARKVGRSRPSAREPAERHEASSKHGGDEGSRPATATRSSEKQTPDAQRRGPAMQAPRAESRAPSKETRSR